MHLDTRGSARFVDGHETLVATPKTTSNHMPDCARRHAVSSPCAPWRPCSRRRRTTLRSHIDPL